MKTWNSGEEKPGELEDFWGDLGAEGEGRSSPRDENLEFWRGKAGRAAGGDPGRGPSPGVARTHPGQAGEDQTRRGPEPSGGNSSRDSAVRAARGRLRGRTAALEDLLEDLRNELEKRQAKKSAEVSPREAPAQGQEEKSQQPDVRSSLSRCGKVTFQLPLEAAPEERVCHFWRSSALKETLGKLQASVTLDPDTAHPELRLSEDGKRVWRGAAPRPLPERPERFELWPFVLGHQGFAAGRHCWHVDVGDGGDWAVGVARESVPRKGRLSLGPQGGIWALEKWGGQLRALTARRVTPVGARARPRRVSVHLDCGGGSVAFLDARDGELLFAFSRAAFGGERLRPWLWVVGARSQLRLCP